MRFLILKVMGHKFLKSLLLGLKGLRISLSQHILTSDLKLIKRKLKIERMLRMVVELQIKKKEFRVVS
jgi:hypothetical protein